jgi:uncharacterized membrane protein YeiH
MSLFQIFDLLGTVAFALSGTMAAINKKLDVFGIFIIAFVTSVGGGTLRDMLIGRTPVGWMTDLTYLYIIILSTVIGIIFRKRMGKLSKTLFLFDTIGLGIFTITGAEIGLQFGLHPIICVIIATMSGSFGGLIRDILVNEIPVILQKEIYALACVAGAVGFLLLEMINCNKDLQYVLTSGLVIVIRLLAVKNKWELRSIYK